MSVKKWYCRLVENDEGVAYAAEMAEGPRSGNYVLHSDYKALAAEMAALRETHRKNVQATMTAHERITALEVALRDVLTFADITQPVDADALTAKVRKAWQVLGGTAETPVQKDCGCGAVCVRRNVLMSNEYCRFDRAATGLAQETPGKTEGGMCKACGYYQGRNLRCLNPDCPSKKIGEKS